MDDLPRRLLEVEVPLSVRTYDIDFAGIVSNLVYLRWFEDLRLEILAEHLPIKQQIADGIGPTILKTEIKYESPLTIHDHVVGRMWLESVRKVRYVVAGEVQTAGRTAAHVRQEGCFVNLESKRPIAIPQVLVAAYQRAVGQHGA